MNTAQRIVLVVGAILVALVTVFPPWEDAHADTKLQQTYNLPVPTYQSPLTPIVRSFRQPQAGFYVLTGQLLSEITGIATAAALLVFAVRSNKQPLRHNTV